MSRTCYVSRLLLIARVAISPGLLGAQSLKVAEKLDVLEQRAAQDSLDAAAQYNVAMGYLSREKFVQAEAALRRAIAIEPQFADAYLALAITHDKDGDYWRARRKGGRDSVKAAIVERDRLFRLAFLLDPLVDVRILGSVSWIRPWGDFATGIKDLVEGKYDNAWGHFDAEVRSEQKRGGTDPVLEVLLWFRALAGAHSTHADDAIADLQELVNRLKAEVVADSGPNETPLRANEYRYIMAALYQQQGRNSQAVALYREVLTQDLGNFMAHVQMARIFEAVRDYPNAITERRRAVEANPDDASLLTDLGVTLGKAGQMEEAASVLRRAADGNPRDTRPLYWLGLACAQLNRPQEAREALTRFVSLAPSRYAPQMAAARERLARLP